MKKQLITSVILLFAVASMSAQAEFGIKSGWYESLKEIDEDSNVRSNEGFYIGTFLEHSFSERFSIQPEVNYMVISNDFDQLHIPVVLKYRIGKKFKLFAGPDMGVLLTDNEDYETFTISAAFGVSYDFTDKLSIELRTNQYSTDVLKPEANTGIEVAKYNGLQLGLTYKFR